MLVGLKLVCSYFLIYTSYILYKSMYYFNNAMLLMGVIMCHVVIGLYISEICDMYFWQLGFIIKTLIIKIVTAINWISVSQFVKIMMFYDFNCWIQLGQNYHL